MSVSASTYLSLATSQGSDLPKIVYATLTTPTAVYDNTFNLATGAASAHSIQDFLGGASAVNLVVENQGPGDILFSCSYFASGGTVASAGSFYVYSAGFPFVLPGMVASDNASVILETSSAAKVRVIGYY